MKERHLPRRFGWALALSLLLGVVAPPVKGQSVQEDRPTQVGAGTRVSVQYTLKLKDQTVVDTNVGGHPFIYTHGTHQILPGLEKALEGMRAGDSKEVTLKPEEAYGAVDENAFVEVGKEELPPDALEIGVELEGTGHEGQIFTARVSEIREETVLLDLNHPLAGKTLVFEVKVLTVQEGQHP